MGNTRTLKPIFENKKHGPGGGFALLKHYWEELNLSLLFMGMDKHSGVPSWQLLFIYVCGLVNGSSSVNQISKLVINSPPLQFILNYKFTHLPDYSPQSGKGFFLGRPLGRFGLLTTGLFCGRPLFFGVGFGTGVERPSISSSSNTNFKV